MNQIKIAIIGLRITRDNFNSQFNPNYSMFFNCVLHHHQGTFLSLMSNPIPYKEQDYVKSLSAFDKWVLRTECTKEFLSLLKERQPDYLLIDLYGDVYSGVIKLSEDEYITDNIKYNRLPPFRNQKEKSRVDSHRDEHLSTWKKNVDLFFEYTQQIQLKSKIVLIKARFTDQLSDGRNLNDLQAQQQIRTINIEETNKLWDEMDRYISQKYHIPILDMTEKEYKINPSHAWGPFYCHYTNDFYHDFYSKLQKIHMEELSAQLSRIKQQSQSLNDLVQQTQKNLAEVLTLNEGLKRKQKKYEKQLDFYNNESFSHTLKRYMLKNPSINKLNHLRKKLLRINKPENV